MGEIERFPVFDAAFVCGEGEQGVDELFLLVAELEGFFAGRAKITGAGFLVG